MTERMGAGADDWFEKESAKAQKQIDSGEVVNGRFDAPSAKQFERFVKGGPEEELLLMGVNPGPLQMGQRVVIDNPKNPDQQIHAIIHQIAETSPHVANISFRKADDR